MAYSYHLESPLGDGWNRFRDGSKGYCDGYMDALAGDYPRSEIRMVRSDGKVVRVTEEYPDVGIGQIAGRPTPEQYESAANRALEKAAKIREVLRQRKFKV